jgi:hypothetical protein
VTVGSAAAMAAEAMAAAARGEVAAGTGPRADYKAVATEAVASGAAERARWRRGEGGGGCRTVYRCIVSGVCCH